MSNELTNYQVAQEWADIVLERWIRNISRLKIKETGELLRSLQAHVEQDANGNPSKITFAFMYYGIFPDMGVGRGVKYDEVVSSNRKKKPWYSKQFIKEVNILGTIIAEKYGEKAAYAVALFENRSTMRFTGSDGVLRSTSQVLH